MKIYCKICQEHVSKDTRCHYISCALYQPLSRAIKQEVQATKAEPQPDLCSLCVAEGELMEVIKL